MIPTSFPECDLCESLGVCIDDNTQTLDLIIEDHNFAEYIKKDDFTLRVKAVTDQAIGQDTEIEADMQFAVKAKVL